MLPDLKITCLLLALAALAVALGQEEVLPRRIHVDASASCGFSCEGTATLPFPTFLSALRAINASDVRLELIVSPGYYNGSGNTGLILDHAQNIVIGSTAGAKQTIIDCESNPVRAFLVSNATLTLRGITIKNCNHMANGGALFAVDSNVTLDAVHFVDNSALNGGAVYAVTLPPKDSGSLIVKSSLFQRNKAVNQGGAIHLLRMHMDVSNSIINCNSVLTQSSNNGADLHCAGSSTTTIDFSSDVQGMGVSCPSDTSLLCSVLYANLTGSSFVSQQMCGRPATCIAESDRHPHSFDAPDVMDLCGNGVCDEQHESCLSCPQDCLRCSFAGVKLETFKCLPEDVEKPATRPSCFFKATSKPVPIWDEFLPSVQRPVTGIVTAYFRVPETDRYTFKLVAQNLGAKVKIDARTAIDAFFPQLTIDSVSSRYLQKELVHTLQVQFYSPRDLNNTIQLLWKSSNESNFKAFNDLFYSLNDCGDGIVDPKEAVGQPLYCSADVFKCQTYNCLEMSAYPTCGNGICEEEFKEDCFVDCHAHLTDFCPQIQAPPGQQTAGIPVSNDTLGTLLKNQYLYRLPGIGHLLNGFDIVKGEESSLPVFYFGFCNDKIVKTVQDTWRGYVYTIPEELFAQPFPQCSFSLESNRFSSSQKMAESMAESSGLSVSVSFNQGKIFTLSLGAAYSQEQSVATAKELETSREGTVLSTEVRCLASKVQIVDYTFHPIFLADLAQVDDVTTMLPLLYKYGTHFYDHVSLGGKLKQVRVTDKSYSSSTTSSEISRQAEWSFSAAVSHPVFSATFDYSGTNEVDVSNEEQQTFESQSSTSKIITYGGAPGSFGPQDEDSSDAPTNFGQWARSIDLLPVPIDYQLRRIGSILPSAWKTKTRASIRDLWQQAEEMYYKDNGIILDGVPQSQYKMTLKFNQLKLANILDGKQALYLSAAFLDRSQNQNNNVPFYTFPIWNQNGPQLLTVDLQPNSNGANYITNTITFEFDGPSNMTLQTTHVAIGYGIFNSSSGTPDLTKPLLPGLNSVLQHVILHGLETGEQFYYTTDYAPILGSVPFPFSNSLARPLNYKHTAIFFHYTVTNLNDLPTITPWIGREPFYAEITFVGTKTHYTVWQVLPELTSGVFYWPDNRRRKNVFEIYQNVTYSALGDLIAVQIRLGANRGLVYLTGPATPVLSQAYVGNYTRWDSRPYPEGKWKQNQELYFPNPQFAVENLWVTLTRCPDIDDDNVCHSSSSEGSSKVWTSAESKLVQLKATQDTVWRMLPLKPL